MSFVIGSFVIGLFVPFAYTLPAYARPALLSTQDQARFASRDAARTNFASQIELLGSELGARSIKPGETLRVTLYWRAITQMPASYRVFVHLVGRGNRVAGGVDAIPIRGAFPTLYWRPGDALKDNYYLPINPNASPGKYAVEVGLYPIGNLSERLVTITGDDHVAVGVIKIAPRAVEKYAPAFRADAVFADQIELFGSESRWVANGLQVNLYWRARTTIQEDYKVFVHALDASGKIIAQVDREPQDGNYPTSIWERGEEILDEYIMPVNLSSGVKRLAIGLYRADSGARLTAIYLGKTDDHIEMTLGVTQ